MKSPHCIIADSVPDIPLPAALRCDSDEEPNPLGNSRIKKRRVSAKQTTSKRVPEVEDYPADATAESWTDPANASAESWSDPVNATAESWTDPVDTKSLTDEDTPVSCNLMAEQKNLGAPVVVDALSKNLSSLRIPEALLQEEIHSSEEETWSPELLCGPDSLPENEETCAIVTELTSTECNTVKQASKKKNSKGINSPDQRKPGTSKGETNEIPWQSVDETPIDISSHEVLSTDEEAINEQAISEQTINEQAINEQDNTGVPRLYSVRNKVVAVMSENVQFCFTGKLVLKVIYGSVDVYGSIITSTNAALEVYSPRGYSSVCIQTRSGSVLPNQSDIQSALAAEGISCETKNTLVRDIESLQLGMAVIVLSNFENKLTKFLHTFYPFKLFPRIIRRTYVPWTDPARAEVILQSKLYFGRSSCKDLIFEPSITQGIGEKMLRDWRAKNWSCGLVAGGKSVGKSTTMRYLINNLIRECGGVIMLDLDPGQAECTPAACISYSLIDQPLMGPNFTHLKMPLYQLYIGDLNISRCIPRYIEAVKLAVKKLTTCPMLSRRPIIVNTMGFTQGLGWDIMIFTIKLIRPTAILQIISNRPKNNYLDYLSKEVVNQQQLSWATWGTNVAHWDEPCEHLLYVIQSQAERKPTPGTEMWNMEPYQQRELTMMSYLSGIIQDSEESLPRPGSLSINTAVPYVAPFSSLYISTARACVPPSHVLNVINGNIVALCGIDITAVDSEETEQQISGLRVLTRSPLCTCYGFGVVRGIDIERQELFINTPIPAAIMQHVNCLMGCVPVPLTLLQLDHFKKAPYIGGNDILPTSREPRRGSIKMRFHNQPESWDTNT